NARVLQDDLGDDPGVERAVVGIDENARAARLFAPPGYADHLAQVLLGRHVDSERAGGEDCRDSRVPAVFRTSIGSGDDGRRIRRCDCFHGRPSMEVKTLVPRTAFAGLRNTYEPRLLCCRSYS